MLLRLTTQEGGFGTHKAWKYKVGYTVSQELADFFLEILPFSAKNLSMWVKSVQLKNVKGFADSGEIEFSKSINVLVGTNNSGKSTLLKSIHLLQPFAPSGMAGFGGAAMTSVGDFGVTVFREFERRYIRLNSSEMQISVKLEELDSDLLVINGKPLTQEKRMAINYGMKAQIPKIEYGDLGGKFLEHKSLFFHPNDPKNFIYPYFSRRKPDGFDDTVNLTNSQTIEDSFKHLPSKIDRLTSDPESERYQIFKEQCRKIFNFSISCSQYRAGKQAGLTLKDGTLLPVESMGEGTINILALLAHLCVANGKLFLIEELENDLHPKALKNLLEFIIQKSETNQFIISTHNNIVLRYLGSVPDSKVFSVTMELDCETKIPMSNCVAIPDDSERRISLLENLGYEPFDFYLWKGYLILEESSAERIIRDFLIPKFVPELDRKLKTIAAKGVTDVEPRFVDFHRLFVFVHTCPPYNGRAWVAVDNGDEGKKVIDNLKSKFSKWLPEHFKLFEQKDFERYYPRRFQEEASRILLLPNGPKKQEEKKRLLNAVLAWTKSDPEAAKAEFKSSAGEVIDFLQQIAQKLG